MRVFTQFDNGDLPNSPDFQANLNHQTDQLFIGRIGDDTMDMFTIDRKELSSLITLLGEVQKSLENKT